MPSGRPLTYTQEIADAICVRLAAGESLNAICKADEMPPESTVRGWALDDVQGFAAKYTRAREIQADVLVEQILDISDDGSRDYVATENGVSVDHDHIARSRLRVDSRKWFASKVLPKKYGDKVALTGDGGGPLSMLLSEIKTTLPIAEK